MSTLTNYTIVFAGVTMLSGCGVAPGGGQGGVNINICNSANSNGDCNQSGTNSNVTQTQVGEGGEEGGGVRLPIADIDVEDVQTSVDSLEETPVVQANRMSLSLLRNNSTAAFVGKLSAITYSRESNAHYPITEFRFSISPPGDFLFLKGRFLGTPPGELIIRVLGGQDPATGRWFIISDDLRDGLDDAPTSAIFLSVNSAFLVFVRQVSYSIHPFTSMPISILALHEEGGDSYFTDSRGHPIVGLRTEPDGEQRVEFAGVLPQFAQTMIDSFGGGILGYGIGGATLDRSLRTVAQWPGNLKSRATSASLALSNHLLERRVILPESPTPAEQAAFESANPIWDNEHAPIQTLLNPPDDIGD